MSQAPNPSKKTVYIDVDEEITGIIDKVRSAKEGIVALVLPKRATVLQSIVNMKLLKRAADQNDKKVVLITSEASLMPLAGAAGLFVAANLQSRPYVPSAPGATAAAAQAPNPNIPEEEEVEAASSAAKSSSGGSSSSRKDKTEPIEFDNTPKDEPEDKAGATAAAAAVKPKKDKSKKIPNFNKFRTFLLVGGIALVLLIIFGWWAFAVAPKATVTLRTESNEHNAITAFTADTDADEVDLEDKVLPARKEELKKTESEKTPATGEKDNGTKASGQMTLRNCTDDKVTIPAGTGISNGGFTFITQESINLDDGNFDSNHNCKNSGSHTGTVGVLAQKNGDQYNLSPRNYTVSGKSGVLAQGGQMSGGTSKIVKVVTAQDVEMAKKKITDKQNSIVEELKGNLEDEGYIGLIDSFSMGNPNFAVTPAVGSEGTEVTVSGEVTYSLFGVKEDDLKQIVKDQVEGVDTTKQSILDYGFDEATFEIGEKSDKTMGVTVKSTLVAGPEIDQNALKKELAGKKRGDAESTLKSRPGITEARVDFSPFWVNKVPSKEAKVTFNIEQADGTRITP